MKVLLKNKTAAILKNNSANHKSAARQLEADGENRQAIELYEWLVKKYPTDAYNYDRLMILYRKEKAFKKELSLLSTAIEKFTGLLHPDKNRATKKIASLSKSILQAVGLTDKKGGGSVELQNIQGSWIKNGFRLVTALCHGRKNLALPADIKIQ